jgi:hypothetical protein
MWSGKKVKLFVCFFLTEHHAMKAYWGSGGIAPLFTFILVLVSEVIKTTQFVVHRSLNCRKPDAKTESLS